MLTIHRSSRWYQFNDEEVTKIKQLGKPPVAEKDKVKKEPDFIDLEDDDETCVAIFKSTLAY